MGIIEQRRNNPPSSPSKAVGVVYDPLYLEHDTGAHVETADRLVAIMRGLEQSGLLRRLTPLPARSATIDELLTNHRRHYIDRVHAVAAAGGGWLDADTVLSGRSYDAALHAAGGLLEALTAVQEGTVGSAMALVRPPGHHALPAQGMGFCLFNNIAIAARVALQKIERVLIVDFDVHHGNGTQEAFYEDPRVLYFSSHLYPHYPGTGSLEETGRGEGVGTTINVPLPAGAGDAEFRRVYNEILVPAARRFAPQLILVSAGYDAHWADPLASLRLSTTGFAETTQLLLNLARELCRGHIVFTLEGGYDLPALSTSVRATLQTLLGDSEIDDLSGLAPESSRSLDISTLIARIKEVHRLS